MFSKLKNFKVNGKSIGAYNGNDWRNSRMEENLRIKTKFIFDLKKVHNGKLLETNAKRMNNYTNCIITNRTHHSYEQTIKKAHL